VGQSGSYPPLAPVIVVHHAGIPVLECGTQRAVQGSGPRLQEQMSSVPAPLHLLLLGKALADDRVHRCFDKSRGDTLAGPVALAIVDQATLIAGDVDLELPHGDPELAQVGIASIQSFEVEQQIINGLAGSIGVAVPEEPLDPAQFIQSCHPAFLVMVHQSLGELSQDRDPHRNVEPVEDVLAARTDPLSEGANLVPAVGDEGQILIGLEALSAQVINDAALRLTIVAMDKAYVPSLSGCVANLKQRREDGRRSVTGSGSEQIELLGK
jgi:hypothetical protein